jgi:hypothetical protein
MVGNRWTILYLGQLVLVVFWCSWLMLVGVSLVGRCSLGELCGFLFAVGGCLVGVGDSFLCWLLVVSGWSLLTEFWCYGFFFCSNILQNLVQ